jgi:predicted cation transporter
MHHPSFIFKLKLILNPFLCPLASLQFYSLALSFLVAILLIGFIFYLFRIRTLDRTASSMGIQGTDVDPDGYAEATGNLKVQGKT